MTKEIIDEAVPFPDDFDPDNIPVVEATGDMLEAFEKYGEPVVLETMEEAMSYYHDDLGLSKKEALDAIIKDCGFDELIEYFRREKNMTAKQAKDYINSFGH